MTTAQRVRNYLRNKPYVLDALEKGIVNLSELSRQIKTELGAKDIVAIKAALRRFSEELQRHTQKREEKVLELLKKSALSVYDKKSVILATKELEIENGMKVSLLNKIVYLLDRSNLPRKFGALKTHDSCTMVVIHSPEELETTPGVVAFLTSLLAEQKINIIEFVSCWTQTIIVVEKKDSLRTYEILSEIVG